MPESGFEGGTSRGPTAHLNCSERRRTGGSTPVPLRSIASPCPPGPAPRTAPPGYSRRPGRVHNGSQPAPFVNPSPLVTPDEQNKVMKYQKMCQSCTHCKRKDIPSNYHPKCPEQHPPPQVKVVWPMCSWSRFILFSCQTQT